MNPSFFVFLFIMKKHIPNIITLANLSCGILAILIALDFNPVQWIQKAKLEYAVYCIFLGAVFDFLDGFTARLLKAYSDIGKELDSLADLVTFGFAPAAITSALISSHAVELPFGKTIFIIPFIIVLFSALRLAKFNVDTRQTTSFIGLPTPANALFFGGIVFLNLPPIFYSIWLPVLCIIFSLLLISELPMFSLKMKSFSFSKNKIQFIFLLGSLVLIAILQLNSISYIILLYIIISSVLFLISKKSI